MKVLRRLCRRLIGFKGSTAAEQDFDAEMESHLSMHTEDNLRAGMDATEARRQALLKLGGLEQTRQRQRESRSILFLEELQQDVHFAARQLRRNKGFATTATLILSLGICANVALFSFVDAALIKPLPYAESSRLMGLFESTVLGNRFHISYLDYLDWKRMNKSFSAVEAYSGHELLQRTPQGVQPVKTAIVSDGFFRLLGVRPVLGRDFHDGEDLPGAPRTLLLSYATWQKEYGGRSDVLGKSVTLDGTPQEIVGVLPQDFTFQPANDANFWMTLHMSTASDRGEHGLSGIGRLKDGVSVDAAQAEMSGIAQRLAIQYPDDDGGRGATVMPLATVVVGNMRPVLLLLFSGAVILLLIACVNVASLLLVRTENRRREMAVRGALGASRARLARQIVTEGALLVTMGAVLGGGSALWLMSGLLRLIPLKMQANMPYLSGLGWNGHASIFLAVLSLLCLLLFSVVPMLRLPASDLQSNLKEGGRGSAGTAWHRMGSALVVIELCLAMMLLVSAGLLSKSFYLLMQTDMGMKTERLAAIHVQIPNVGDLQNAQKVQIAQEAEDAVRALPGVEQTAITRGLPAGGGGNHSAFQIRGRVDHDQSKQAVMQGADWNYFNTVQASLASGRYFTDADDVSRLPVIIVNETLVRKYFANEDPIEKQIQTDATQPPMTIVGVVRDIRESALDEPTEATIYTPFAQDPHDGFYIVARTAGSPKALLSSLAEAVRRNPRHLLTTEAETIAERINDSQAAYLHRSSAWLVGGFAVIALILGIVGIYGVIAYSVAQRTREIGVRMALGAQRSQVSGLVLREAGVLVAVGVLSGALSSLGAGHLMRSLLFGVSAWDMPTLIAIAVALSTAAMLASLLPAMRAAKVDPMVALRAE